MSPTILALILIAVLVGSVVPMQAGVNATIAKYLGHPLYGALTNTLVASLVVFCAILIFRLPVPRLGAFAAAPWWAWAGGILGAISVLSALIIAPRLGAASYVSAIIVGTMIASLLLDHFGLVGYREQPVNSIRLGGAALVVIGMAMIQSDH